MENAPSLALLLVALGALALSARGLGGLAARLGLPAVVGEVLVGVLLGSTVLGRIWPTGVEALLASPARGGVLSQVSQIALLLFMLSVGLELDLQLLWRERRHSLAIGIAGLVVPFMAGLACSWWTVDWLRGNAQVGNMQFCLLFATALSVSALPVIVKIFGDLGLLGTRLAAIVITSAAIDDLAGWGLLGLALALGTPSQIGVTRLLSAIAYGFFMLRLGPRVLERALGRTSGADLGSRGKLTIVLGLAALNAALSEVLGLHAVFGSFLTGLCLAQAPVLDAFTRRALNTFGTHVCAPVFFATIALHVDFGREFDPALVIVVLLVASVGKIVGCAGAALFNDMDWKGAAAVAFSMNARGAMEIVFGQLALERGLIDARLFVALVVMALVTSVGASCVLRFLTASPDPMKLIEASRTAAV